MSSASRAGAGRDDVIRVTGGRPLHGRLCVGGSKNATLPILAACLLTAEPVRVTNLAEVTDTQVMLEEIRIVELLRRSLGIDRLTAAALDRAAEARTRRA